MVAVLQTSGLTKHFGEIKAVQDLNLEVQEGDIYGFLGLNGSGKTTTMRMILRLIRPTSGTITIFGQDVQKDFIQIMKRVGSLIELPAYYPYLSAVRNLEVLRLATGGIAASRIPEVLEIVGLRDRMHDRVGTYSQGMRQRLGIAMALLPRPRLIFLDEPTNGLDPHGINHIRGVIQELNQKEGVTFVLSSHLLHEVEITCTRVGILKQGRLILQDTMRAIVARTVSGVRVVCDQAAKAESILKAQPWSKEVRAHPGGGLRVMCEPARFAEVNALLAAQGIAVSELSPVRQTLEDLFLST
ncbi:MAG TPA: ABC transporter ATP-binding protein [Planctomycetota bacterium]|nr:ABC transporter ATP-binding protein [Planctomycetota bacterium]